MKLKSGKSLYTEALKYADMSDFLKWIVNPLLQLILASIDTPVAQGYDTGMKMYVFTD